MSTAVHHVRTHTATPSTPAVTRLSRCALAIAGVLVLITSASAQMRAEMFAEDVYASENKAELLKVDEKLGDQIPLNLTFLNSAGETVTLADYINGDKPAILTLNFFRCPHVCGLQLNQLVATMNQAGITPGDEFELITISFNPREGPNLAREKKLNYISMLGKPEAADGWHFLTMTEGSRNAAVVANSVGYPYYPARDTEDYAHPVVTMILTPNGNVARYLYSFRADGETDAATVLRLSVIEAGEGTVQASLLDQFRLRCFIYDPDIGAYVPMAMAIMQIAGTLTFVTLAIFIGSLWVWDRRRAKALARGEIDEAGNPIETTNEAQSPLAKPAGST